MLDIRILYIPCVHYLMCMRNCIVFDIACHPLFSVPKLEARVFKDRLDKLFY
jgi:hypothetical protein